MSRRSSSSRREGGGGGGGGGGGAGGGGGSYYPTQWSQWEWKEQYQRHVRYRLKGPGEYEYDEATPRTSPSLASTEPSSQPLYTAQVNYTTASPGNIESITQSLAQTALVSGSSSSFQQPPSQSQYQSQYQSQSRQSGPNFITTRNPHTMSEEFDPHYKVHGAWEFKYGRIFKVLWTEPKGNDGHGSTGGSSTGATISERPGKHGEVHYEKVRRFVIINAMDGHCICLPIMTYGGQGVNKKGVHAKHHTIIHTSSKPIAFKGEKEKGLIKKPIRVEPINARHKLDSASRLNYAKPYTVEYNVKVWFIGKVHPDSEWLLGADYNRVHPPIPPRGSRPIDEASDDSSLYQAGYFDNTYSSGSSYQSMPAYPMTFPPSGTSSSSYTTGPLSGVGTTYSSYTSQPSLDPVIEHEPGEAGPSEPFDSSKPAQGYGHENPPGQDYYGQEPLAESDQQPAVHEDLYGPE